MMITKRPLFYWVKTSSIKLQLLLLLVVVVIVGARLLPLELQKRIVNKAISLKKVDLLFLYCWLYLAAVVTAGALKYVSAVLQTYIGQQALARIRTELYAHIITLPLEFFRKSSSGMIVTALVTEVATAGEFVGQAVAVPLTNLLTLITFAAYMFYLNPLMAALSFVIYPIVVYIVPKLQERSNRANKQRVDTTRKISSKIGEAISGIHEIHSNGSFRIENSKYQEFVEQLLKIRVVWILYKQGVKALNSFFQSLGKFMLFLVGGYLAINGRFDLGALVAFLSAYETLYDPWKELMDFYQVYQDANVSYARIMEYFDVEPQHLLEPPDRDIYKFNGDISVKDVSFAVGGGIQLLKQINMDLKQGEQFALVGFSGSGKSTLAQCIGQLHDYTGGSIQLDGVEVLDLTKRDVAKNIGVVAQAPYIFDGTIRENLLYSCEAMLDSDSQEEKQRLPSLDEMIQVMQQVGIFVDVLRFGLNKVIGTDQEEELVQKLIRIRHNFRKEFGEELAEFVEFFHPHYYLYYSTVAANLTFGNPDKEEFTLDQLPSNPYFLAFLDQSQIKNPLVNLGRDLAEQAIDILGNLPPDDVFFQNSPISIEEFEAYKTLVGRIKDMRLHEISDEDRHMLLRLALRFVPGIHKMVALPKMLENLILDSRHMFMGMVAKDHPGAVAFYRMEEYIHTQTVLDNILFGKTRSDQPKAQDQVHQRIIQLLIEEDLLERIVEIGMNFGVGTKGDRLSGGQRQKLAIARVFLKKPPVLIMDEATSALDNRSQQRIQNLLETKWKGKSTVISVVHRLDTIKGYDKVAVMKAGKIMEIGSYEDLIARKGLLYELVHGARAGA